MKKIITVIIFIVILSSLFLLNIGAEDIKWQTALENLLTKFPTILDETAMYEAGGGIVHPIDADGVYVPCGYRFHDLDGDNIPEVIINFGLPESEWVFDKVYKLYDGSYEQIGQAMFLFYTTTEGKLVAATRSSYTINAIYFAEIQDKTLVFSDFIDSKGNDNFNGVKYDSFSEFDGTSLWDARDADETLQLLPEIDCSDIVNAARNKVYGSPKTGDNNLLIIFIVLLFFIIIKVNKYTMLKIFK